jgi:hypothetical protein
MTEQFTLIPPEDVRYTLTEFVVEATSCEQLAIWDDWHEKMGWAQDGMGRGETIGFLSLARGKRPVILSVSWNVLDGHRVMFWHICSRYADTKMVDEWLCKYVAPRWDNGTRLAHTNAMNFHHVLNYLREKEGVACGK